MTPTMRTNEWLRERGYLIGPVERWIPRANIRSDYLGIIDIIGVRLGETIGVQSCGEDFSKPDAKILASDNSLRWIQAGNVLMLIAWRKLKVKRGGKAMKWEPRIKYYTEMDFPVNEDSVPF